MDSPRDALAAAFREQAAWSVKLASPLYAALQTRLAEDVEADGVCWRFLEPLVGDSARTLTLRFLAMLHRRALEGAWPELARCYPTCGGDADTEAAGAAIRSALEANPGWRASVPAGVQTNEVSRSCALLPGFLSIASRSRLPLRLLEIGCSAGLNLRWDQYRYQAGEWSWGDPASPVVFDGWLKGEAAFATPAVQVVERRGCDLHPIQPTAEGRLDLLSFLWPDQVARMEQLNRAFACATRVPARIDCADAVEWTARQLAEVRRGVATVLYHSVFWMYLTPAAQARIEMLIANAGRRASADAPVAWLRMEAGRVQAEIDLTYWPDGETEHIAKSSFHGRDVELLNPA